MKLSFCDLSERFGEGHGVVVVGFTLKADEEEVQCEAFLEQDADGELHPMKCVDGIWMCDMAAIVLADAHPLDRKVFCDSLLEACRQYIT